MPHGTANVQPSQSRNIFRKILHGGKWQNFAAGVACGAAYISLAAIHWHRPWLTIIEIILFFINCLIFTLNWLLILSSAYLDRDVFVKRTASPAASLLIPLAALDFATICIGTVYYAHTLGGFDANRYPVAYISVFWVYFGASLVCCVPIILYWFGSIGKAHELSSFSLTGCFMVFPMMLVGSLAITILARIDPVHSQSLPILLIGYIMQGLGFTIAMCFIVVSQYRAIRYGFNRGASSATAFIAAGPPGYTALVLLRLGEYGQAILPLHTSIPQIGADIIRYSVIPTALMLQGVAIYFWFFALVPWAIGWRAHLYLNPAGAWPLTFPSTGIILTFSALGDTLEVPAFWILQAIFAGIVVFEFVVIFCCWLYRLVQPSDPRQKDVRYAAYAQEHLSFWSSWREAELAEQRYLKEKRQEETSA